MGSFTFRMVGINGLKRRQVFTDKQEEKLENSLLTALKIHFGLSSKEIRMFAPQCAKQFLIETVQSCEENGCSSSDWFTFCIKRYPNLSIRAPKTSSLARATNFKTTNVAQFVAYWNEVIGRSKFYTVDILVNWCNNCSETLKYRYDSNVVGGIHVVIGHLVIVWATLQAMTSSSFMTSR